MSALSDSDLQSLRSDLERRAKSIKEEVDLLMAQKLNEEGQEIARIKTLVTK
jgi:hypothetical protein